MDLSGRTVLIVGGTSGIGLGLARRFASAGRRERRAGEAQLPVAVHPPRALRHHPRTLYGV
jgi:NAD(P)-dependent dehydrogenase (short-subunit alcohol dehydrogenase family)